MIVVQQLRDNKNIFEHELNDYWTCCAQLFFFSFFFTKNTLQGQTLCVMLPLTLCSDWVVLHKCQLHCQPWANLTMIKSESMKCEFHLHEVWHCMKCVKTKLLHRTPQKWNTSLAMWPKISTVVFSMQWTSWPLSLPISSSFPDAGFLNYHSCKRAQP